MQIRKTELVMSKFTKALYEMEHISQMAELDQWMNRIHPLVKFLLTIGYIFTVVSFPKYDLLGVVSMVVYPLILFLLADLSIKDAIYRLRVVLPVVCIVGIFNPFFDREIVTYIGSIGISGGVVSMLSLLVKGILTVLASYLLIATTSIEKICYAMRLLHIPKLLVTQILLIYRYMSVLLSEAKRITQAYALRAPGQKGIRFQAWGSLVGQLLLRSMDKADNVYESMCLRGYQGEFPLDEAYAFRVKDALFFLVWCAVFVLFRIFPVFYIIGAWFV
jgi:cobalt/nickel transport system permease protein